MSFKSSLHTFFMMRINIPFRFLSLLLVGWLLLSCANKSLVHQVEQNAVTPGKSLEKVLPNITAENFKRIKDSGGKFILLDVREKEEYNAAHLPGAINISLHSLGQEIPNRIKDTDTKIYVYCMVGVRSALAGEILTEMGYTNVINISDSFKGWVEAGYPVYNQLGEFIMTPDGYEKKE